MNDKKQPSQTLPRSGHVKKLRQDWVLRQDQVLAENLQDEELKNHIGGVQKKHSIIREDTLHAKIEQTREDEIAANRLKAKIEQTREDELAANSLKTKDELMAKQEYKDYLFARELEKQDRDALKNERRERRATHTVPEKKQSKSIPPTTPGIVDVDEERRRIQLEQDAELSRRLQSMDVKQEGALQGIKMSAIEAKDYELAKMLQEQENSRLRESLKEQENARLRETQGDNNHN